MSGDYVSIWQSDRRYFQFSVVFEHRGENFEEISSASLQRFFTFQLAPPLGAKYFPATWPRQHRGLTIFFE